jgi:lysozyme
MNVSQNAIDLIKPSEGLELKAYLDPVGIPTIGYGTIRYPDGKRVAMGDSISEAEAEAFLKFECEKIADDLTRATQGIPLNQNQFDALVSFCYNLGLGAFVGSTLLTKLKAGDVAGAADEFPRWNKGTVNGIKKVLPGLVIRRGKERALFLDGNIEIVAPPSELSDEEKVTHAKGFRPNGANLIAAFDVESNVVEVLELTNALPDTFIGALRLYPNLKNFDFAKDGEPVPVGKRVTFSGLARPIIKVPGAPDLNRPLLIRGMEDEEGGGNDIREMQRRLAELGYYTGKVDGIFGPFTDQAVRDFQEDYFGIAQADGRVGKKTWGKLWGEAEVSKPTQPGTGTVITGDGAPGKHYLLLTRTDQKDQFGCTKLVLSYFKNGAFVHSIDVCSGQPRKQIFRKGEDSRAGSMEPLPEGKWSIKDIEWADGKDNYVGAVWNNGLGPAKIRMDFLDPGNTGRSAIEIHIDWNRSGAPGTAGCIGVQNVNDFRTLVGWLRETNPRSLFVDWGLGSCPTP